MRETIKQQTPQEKYQNTPMMKALLACNGSMDCIGRVLEEYDYADLTLEEIGLALGVDKERVRQIEEIALKRVKLQHMRKGQNDLSE